MRIPVRDGIHLSARVWMPEGALTDPMPAILEILPYRKRDGTAARDATTHAVFAEHDYVCVRVDLRGCGESEGLYDDEYSEQELRDIEDVIAWIAAQTWCSGAVGIMGISWGGFNGLQVAARTPPALKAVISLCSSVDRFADDIHYKGGCQLTENIGWAATATSWFSMPPDPALVGESWRDIWLRRLENMPDMIDPWIEHGCRDGYWKHASVCEDFTTIEAAVLSIGGWHDGYRNTAAKLLDGNTSGPVKAIMGPWNHKYPHLAAPEPRMDFVSEALRWWDHWLKGVENGADQDPDYRAYVMDAVPPQTSYETRPGRWVGLPKWPAPEVERLPLILGQGTLGREAMDAPLSVATAPACGQGFGEYFPFGFGPGELPDDQQADDALSLCFETDVLDAPQIILGAPHVRLSLSADAPFAQIAVRLCDVAPSGASTLITAGFLNLQFREGFEAALPLTPGEIYEIALDLDQAGYEVPAGHLLRLAMSPSYWPFIWPERDDVTLSVSGGQLDLPVLSAGAGMDWDCPTGQRETDAVTASFGPLVEEKRLIRENGQHVLDLYGDQGETQHLDHGLRTSSKRHEIWSIDETNVAHASAEIVWERSMAREDFSVSTIVTSKMHSDSENFHVKVGIQAVEDGQRIFEREINNSYRRDLTRRNHNKNSPSGETHE